MKFETINLDKALNQAYFKQNLKRDEIDLFKRNFKRLFERINETESEEHNKNIVSDFLKNTFYKEKYEINTAERKDLVIHKGNTSQTPVSVIIEAKSPTNKSEMISFDKPNAKALHETIHYYLKERIINQNKEIKHLIITNIYDWFVFDAVDFEKYFYANKDLRKNYQEWIDKELVGTKTDWFYTEIAKPFIENELETLQCVHINLLEYAEVVKNEDQTDDSKLINLYKILSPEHLLKLPFANDYNKIDTGFYNELLYILGLEETKEGGKKLITRVKEKERQAGSLLENSIGIIHSLRRLKHIERLDLYGETEEEQIFSVALELNITWLNRILFLKLLEAQLIKYHNSSRQRGKGNKDFAFLNSTKIRDFDELNELFFEVLAKKPQNRTSTVNDKFGELPYLNSSLFEQTELEDNSIYISQLKDRLTISTSKQTVLKDKQGNKLSDELNTLEYLFEFLNAYSFASDDKAEIQDDNRTIINAAVLGLIFEKINGYKDGSFYTPSFITTYISRSVLKNTLVTNFSKALNKPIADFEQLKELIEYTDKEQRQKANEIINSIKIVDPAVGSGHFLVSVLNELVALKSELRILQNENGNRLRGIKIENINDELQITNEETSEHFQYYVNDKHIPPTEIQEVQQTLFNEKRILIENCLFGVDINPKSVLICRLRMWIELLKNSFYTADSNYKYLETLPNIDINIKAGNSLISKFDTGLNIFERAAVNNLIVQYKLVTDQYKITTDYDQKLNFRKTIQNIKNELLKYAIPQDKNYKQYLKKQRELQNLIGINPQSEAIRTQIVKLSSEVAELEKKYQENYYTLYANSMEWSIDFPEILSDNGEFVGFDIVLGNPPYGVTLKKTEKDYYKDAYEHQDYQLDTYLLFLERAFHIAKQDANVAYIIPNTWLTNLKFKKIRKYLTQQKQILNLSHYSKYVFSEAVVDTEVLILKNSNKTDLDLKVRIYNTDTEFSEKKVNQKSFHTNGETINIFLTKDEKAIFDKMQKDCEMLDSLVNLIIGMKPYQKGKGKPKQTEDDVKNRIFDAETQIDDSYKKLLRGSDISKYSIDWQSKVWIKFGENLAEPRFSANFDAAEKIVIRQTGDTIIAAFDTEQFICMNNLHVITLLENSKIKLKYLLALLNSKLLDFYHQCLNPEKGEALAEIKKENVGKLPIKIAGEAKQNEIIALVDKALKLKSEDSKADISTEISAIDKLVYDIYDLKPEEIEMIEKQ